MLPLFFRTPTTSQNYFTQVMDELLNSEEKTSIAKPLVNIIEDNKFVKIEVALPGFSKKEIDINVENDYLSISAKKDLSNKKSNNYIRQEFGNMELKRTFSLPDTIEQDKIVADFKDGILYLELLKKDSAIKKGPKTISIK